jgi:hypothetical protein
MIRMFLREPIRGIRAVRAAAAVWAAVTFPPAVHGVNAAGLACEEAPSGVETAIETALGEGRFRQAEELAAAELPRLDRCASELLRAHLAIERRDWAAAIAVNPAECDGDGQVPLWYARGLAAARAIGRSENLAALPVAREALDQVRAAAETAGPRSGNELRRLVLNSAIVASQDEREELKILLVHAASIAERLSDRCAILVAELAGDLWLQVDRYEDARRAYASALARRVTRAPARLGLARAEARLGNRAAAMENYQVFIDRWQSADAGRPEVVEAHRFLDAATRP